VHGRQAEHRHHSVADELLRPAPERLKLLGRRVEEPAEDLAGPFGVQASREPRGVHEVGEQHRDHLPFLGAERRADGRAAVRAESGAFGEQLAADLAGHGLKHRGDEFLGLHHL
jgi:hypothetical protein